VTARLKRSALRTGWGALIGTALFLAASAAPAEASVVIGQVGDPATSGCTNAVEWVQPTVTSGNPYVVPGTGTITSWTTFGGANPADQLKMKVFRAVPGQAGFYQVVGHDGPRTITPGGTTGNTFPANIAVKPGDLLGFHTVTSGNKCAFQSPGDTYYAFSGDIPDGQSNGPFFAQADFRLDIEATFAPTNSFSLGATTRNKKKGTARQSLNLPNPGDLTASGKGVRATSAAQAVTSKSVGAGPAQLLVMATGKKRKKLSQTGKVTLSVAITYTPTFGAPSTQSEKVKLIEH
jgi:hypothetical protein